jgi:hypothetical protein
MIKASTIATIFYDIRKNLNLFLPKGLELVMSSSGLQPECDGQGQFLFALAFILIVLQFLFYAYWRKEFYPNFI